MNDELIETALREATDTREVVVGQGALGSVPAVFRREFGEDATAALVADATTWRVAGERVQEGLEAAGVRVAEPYRFPSDSFLHASYPNIEQLRDHLRGSDVIPVAVGSGVLNDIVKRAAFELEQPYMIVATAASMDGYTAFGAAITDAEGFKSTMECPAPRAVLADVDVLSTAPPNMTASGYGDLLGKITAGADWIVADALGVEAINRAAWDLVQGPVRNATSRPAELADGDPDALGDLVAGLVMSGLGMQADGSSRPASGAEHQFSHLWEMEGLGEDRTPPLSHGFKVGVGSVAVAALYERLLDRDLATLDIGAVTAAWPSAEEMEAQVRSVITSPSMVEPAVTETMAKYIDADALAERLGRVVELWPELRKQLADQLLPATRLRDMLRAVGAPADPDDIGLTRTDLKDAYRRARLIRRRYTSLDLAAEAGVLDDCVDELFAPGGFWAR